MTFDAEAESAAWGAPLEERDSLAEERGNQTRRGWWWMLGIHQGRRILLGPFATEEEANSVGYSKIQGNFDVYRLPTRDESSATRMLKGKLVQDVDLDEAMKKFRHPREEEY